MQWTKKRILILGMTYPSYSRKYVESVCTGAIDAETNRLIRIHPMPLRYMDAGQRFKNWQWITVDCCPNSDDPRPESFRIEPDSVEVGEEIPSTRPEDRASILLKSPHLCESLQHLKERQESDSTSLGILKPKEILDVRLRPRPETERQEWLAKERELLSQQTLPFLRAPKKLDFPEVAFLVKWLDSDDTVHEMSLKQWGIHELYRKMYDDPQRDSKVIARMEADLDLDRREVFFFLGNFRSRLYQFGLMDSYSPKRVRQAALF